MELARINKKRTMNVLAVNAKEFAETELARKINTSVSHGELCTPMIDVPENIHLETLVRYVSSYGYAVHVEKEHGTKIVVSWDNAI